VLSYRGKRKQFLQLAPIQRTLLNAFQEEGWPAWIHNPLPMLGDELNEVERIRIRDAVSKFNTRNKCGLRLGVLDRGKRIVWSDARS
jgi:hypothetical protein